MAEIFGANIATRVGDGAAQIYDTSKIEAQIQKQIDQERKRQDLENQQIANQISKIKLDGARQADTPILSKAYGATVDAFNKMKIAEAKNDKQGAIDARAALSAAQSDLMNKIQQSKAENQSRAIITHDLLANKKDYVDNGFNTWNKSENISTFDPSYRSAADISQIQRKPESIDLNKISFDNAGQSTVKAAPQTQRDGSTKFDVTSTKLDKGILSKRLEMEYYRSPGIASRIDQVYDPDNMNPNLKASLQAGSKTPLITALDYYKEDAYQANAPHFDQINRKQLTERAPRAGATVINFTPPGVENAKKQITVAGNGIATTEDNFQFPSVKLSTAGSPDLKDAKTGKSISTPGSFDVYGSELNVLPVYKKGTIIGGKDVSGQIIDDGKIDAAKANGSAQYKVMFQGNHGNVVGLDGNGNPVYSKDPTSVYVPASQSVLTILQQKTAKDKLPAVQQRLAQLIQKASILNSKISNPSVSESQPKSVPSQIKVNKKQKLDF